MKLWTFCLPEEAHIFTKALAALAFALAACLAPAFALGAMMTLLAGGWLPFRYLKPKWLQNRWLMLGLPFLLLLALPLCC